MSTEKENPITEMLREDGRRDRSFAAVATSAMLHLSLAGVVVFASAFAVAPPPPYHTVPVIFVPPSPVGPPPPPAPKGVPRPEKEQTVKPVTHEVVRPVRTTPTLVVPSEPAEVVEAPVGVENGSDHGVLGGEEWGQDGGDIGGTGDVVGAPPVDFGPPETIASSFERARLISRVEPVYPTIGRKANIQGVVILEAIIDTDGTVVEVSVLRSIPLLDDAAMVAVRQWRFEPGFHDGRPVRQRLTVTVNFRLNR